MDMTSKTIKIKELNIEVEISQHDQGKKFSDIKIPGGWRLLTMSELLLLHNNQELRKQLNIENTWEIIDQPFEFNKEKGQITAFYCSPYGASFYCNRSPLDAIPSLGVRFCRSLSE